MAIPCPFVKFRGWDLNGLPLVGGQLFTYLAGTTVPQSTYTDSSGITSNTNPVVLDANGYADVWLGSAQYKLILQDANGVVQWTEDNVDGTGSGGNTTAAWTQHPITDAQVATALTGETVDFATFQSADWNFVVKRGTTVISSGIVSIQNLNATGVVQIGPTRAGMDHGITFTVTQVGTVCTLNAAASSGPGNGTITMNKTQVPK